MIIYYAHSMSLYNTQQEKRDIDLLESLGFEVCNPNTLAIQADIIKLKEQGVVDYMDYFYKIMDGCGALAFRGFPDGMIGAGVWHEIQYMQTMFKPIIELPSLLDRRALGLKDTRTYLKLVGQR